MSPKVSVIVPVYNVEKTLNRCMQSITGQSYGNIEIVLVDDGSTDQSGSICEEWKNVDNRVVVVHKKNAGLGEARNTGISVATGKYICFCDSDDYLHDNTIKLCVEFAEKHNADIVHFGFILLTSDLKEKGLVKAKKEYLFAGDDIRRKFIPGMLGNDPEAGKSYGLWLSLCSSFISLEVIKRNNWKCKSEREIISEDTYSLLELYNYIKVAGIIPYSLYYYIENPKSLSHTYRPDRYMQIEKFYHMIIAECRRFDYGIECEKPLTRIYVSYTIAATKQIATSKSPLRQRLSDIRKIENSELLQVLFKEKHDYELAKRILMKCMLRKWTLFTYALCRLKG